MTFLPERITTPRSRGMLAVGLAVEIVRTVQAVGYEVQR